MSPVLPHGLDLLTRAAGVASRSIDVAAGTDPTTPTPCTEWDLGTLVDHVADSAFVLRLTITDRMLGTRASPPPGPGCAAAQEEIMNLLETVRHAPRDVPRVGMAALVGSYELAMHAWDINQATSEPTDRSSGYRDFLPDDLVVWLLALSPLVVRGVDRDGLFAERVVLAYDSVDRHTATDRLLAIFGRRVAR